MGSSKDFAAFQRKLDLVGKGLSGSQLRQITTRVGGKAKAAIVPDVHPDGLSNWGRGRGGKVTARYDVKSDSEVAVIPKPPSLAVLLEAGSYKAGTTWKAPKRRGSKRRKRGTVGTYTRARVPARHSWSNAVRTNEPKVPRWVDEEVQRLLRQVF